MRLRARAEARSRLQIKIAHLFSRAAEISLCQTTFPFQIPNIILKTVVAGLKMPHLHEITLAFEFLVLTLTVPGLRAKNFKILRAFAYLRHFHSP